VSDEREQYTFKWQHGSPESMAHYRDMNGTATVDDLLFLALVNSTSADEALPPWATWPEKNNLGAAFPSDPWHASACSERACAYIQRARGLLAAQSRRAEGTKSGR